MTDKLEKFRVDDLRVAEGENWIVVVRAKQVTYGSLVVLPQHPVELFSQVSTAAATDAFSMLGRLEEVARRQFGCSRINVVAAMMKDPFIHFHFFPRYDASVERDGKRWTDEDWPKAVTLRDVPTTEGDLVQVRDEWRRALES